MKWRESVSVITFDGVSVKRKHIERWPRNWSRKS